MAAHQALPSLGFSRQEYWSGLPFPSPMHEREKWKWSHSVVSDSSRPHGLQLTGLLHPWDFPGKSTGVGCHCLLWSTWIISFIGKDKQLFCGFAFWCAVILKSKCSSYCYSLLKNKISPSLIPDLFLFDTLKHVLFSKSVHICTVSCF